MIKSKTKNVFIPVGPVFMTSGELAVDNKDTTEERNGPDQLLLKFVEDAKSASNIKLPAGSL